MRYFALGGTAGAVLAIIMISLFTPVQAGCDNSFASPWITLGPLQSQSYDLAITTCDFDVTQLDVFGNISRSKKSPQIHNVNNPHVWLAYTDSNGTTFSTTEGWLTIEPPTFNYTVTITNTHHKSQRLRLRAAVK